jgi:hypothetical protein
LIGKVNNSVKVEAQTLTDAQKEQARKNIGAAAEGEGGGSTEGAVLYTEQTLTEPEKAQARKNIGAVSSWNDLKDRPFGDYPTGGDTLTWDGNTEGLEVFMDVLYKVSDATPTIEDFANGFSLCMAGEVIELPSDWATVDAGAIVISDPDGFLPYAFIVSESVAAENGVSAGTYLLSFDMSTVGLAGMLVVEQLTLPGYAGFAYTEQIKPKYLPKIPVNKLPGAIFLYTDADNYLYADADTSDVTRRLTTLQLSQYFRSGCCMYQSTLDDTIFYPINRVGFQNGVGVVVFVDETMAHTAEYTPPAT